MGHCPPAYAKWCGEGVAGLQEPWAGSGGRFAGAPVCLVLGASTGGLGRHVRVLVEALVAARAQVSVAGPADTLSRFGYAAAGAGVVQAAGPAGLPRLRSAVAGAEVVHAHGLTAGLLAGVATSRAVPFAVTWHNAAFGGRARRGAQAAAEHYLARRATVTLCVSPDRVRRAAACGGRPRLIPVGAARLPATRRSRRQVRADLGVGDRALLVCVARLAPQKGLDVLIEAASLLARHPRRPLVVIAGEGPLQARLASRIADSAAPVRLLGPRSDVADLLAAADLAVLPSHWEGSPLAAHEALQAGCPLVATAVGGVPALTGADAALLVPPGDPRALARALAGLLDDEEAAQALARRGLCRARDWPDAARSAASVLDVYAQLLG